MSSCEYVRTYEAVWRRTVNCIAPGPFMTRHALISVLSPAEKQAFADRTALGPLGSARRVGRSCANVVQRRRQLRDRSGVVCGWW